MTSGTALFRQARDTLIGSTGPDRLETIVLRHPFA